MVATRRLFIPVARQHVIYRYNAAATLSNLALTRKATLDTISSRFHGNAHFVVCLRNELVTRFEFELAAFKGRKLSYRSWNGQLRQPILLATPKLTVTVSPQPGFLHPTSELDTLGSDKPESPCKAYASP